MFKFFTQDIWKIPLDRSKRLRSFLIKTFRIMVASLKGFSQDACTYKAAALSFYTLLSIVPFLAIAFGITKGFGFDKLLENEILETLSQQKEVASQIITFSRSLLEQARGGVIAGLGVFFMIWTAISLLGNLENALNEIWQVKIPRSLGRKFSDYLAMIILCPLFFVSSSSMTVFLSRKIVQVVTETGYLATIGPFLGFLFHLFPWLISWLLFTFIYILLPNAKVTFKAGALAGLFAGTAFQIVQWLYISVQFAISSYGAIYGSFAALPLFLIWLQISWLIVFAGAEVSYHIQNARFDSLYVADMSSVAVSVKEIILWIVARCIRNFNRGSPISVGEISHELSMPIQIARQLVRDLENGGVMVQVHKESGEESYLPARDTKDLTIKFVCDALHPHLRELLRVKPSDELKEICQLFQIYNEEVAKSPSNIPLKL